MFAQVKEEDVHSIVKIYIFIDAKDTLLCNTFCNQYIENFIFL